jgi:hypothetical protein
MAEMRTMAIHRNGKRINRVRQLIEDAKEMRLELQRPIVLALRAFRYSVLDRVAEDDAAALARFMREGTCGMPPRAALGHSDDFAGSQYADAARIGATKHKQAPQSAGESRADGGRSEASPVVPRWLDGRCGQGVAPTATASWHHSRRQGKAAGKCRTRRRTERSSQTPSFNSRSRSVVTCAVAHAGAKPGRASPSPATPSPAAPCRTPYLSRGAPTPPAHSVAGPRRAEEPAAVRAEAPDLPRPARRRRGRGRFTTGFG